MASDVAASAGFSHPPLHRYYRALDEVAEAKAATEAHLYARLTDLTNLDLRLVWYDHRRGLRIRTLGVRIPPSAATRRDRTYRR